MDATVSVIIPAYNSEKYISRCLDSVFSQTYNNLRVIVVNDGSTDKTSDILQEYQSKYDNLTVIYQENGGVSKARNVGIDASDSEYIAFIDADDTIDNDYIETLINAIRENGADIVVCGCRNTDTATGELLFTDSPLKHMIPLEDGNSIVFWGAPWGKLCKSSLVKGRCYFKEGEIFEDDPYSIMLHSLAGKLVPIEYIGYNYCVNNPSSSMGIEAREHRFVERFPYSAYEDAIKQVVKANEPKCFSILQIYYLRIMMANIYTIIGRKKAKGIIAFHYEMSRKYSLTKRVRFAHLPMTERLKLGFMVFATKTRLI